MDRSTESSGHILILSYPLQGHAAPLAKLSHLIAKHGVKVTFVTTEFTYAGIAASMAETEHSISLVAVPDGLDADDDRKDLIKLAQSINRVMPIHLENLLKKAKTQVEMAKMITGVIVDSPLGFMLDIPRKMGIKTGIFWCSSPGCLALALNIPNLVCAKIIDADGNPLKNEKLQLLPDMPGMSPTEFTWYYPGNPVMQHGIFHAIEDIGNQCKQADWLVCNWFNDLDPSAYSLTPNIVPVGPLLAYRSLAGSFYPEDKTCLSWLDKQPQRSVIYVAFGSTSRFSQEQLEELAMGLELMGRPFLWVAWSGLTNGSFPACPEGFRDRVSTHAKIIEWAPQEMVLSHPSIVCFLSHCGWSSTMESLLMGVPLLCWPYFGDQMYTKTCICEGWKVGLELNPNENGIISRYEIKLKVEQILSNGEIHINAQKLGEMARKNISHDGFSTKSMQDLVAQIKQ